MENIKLINEYEEIFVKDIEKKAARSKAYKATVKNKEKDRRHGKHREITRKEELQCEFYWDMRGKKEVPLYRRENKKKDFVPDMALYAEDVGDES